jgi:hypothetical protein
MHLNPKKITPSLAGNVAHEIPENSRIVVEPSAYGVAYLQRVQQLALEPAMVDVFDLSRQPDVCRWIGTAIDQVNAELNTYLEACHACFHVWERRSLQILAAPLEQSFGIDGLCNIETQPITLLIDVGRVMRHDWLGLVIHEYAHAHLGSPGHTQSFATVLTHLCLGLGLEPPIWQAGQEDLLRHWPYAKPTPNPLAFWMGQAC